MPETNSYNSSQGKDSQVEILLSTFNGGKYLGVQLNSLLNQDYKNWKLIIRDDGSTDNTMEILNKYAIKHPEKIVLLSDNEGNLGYSKSYEKLLKQSISDYVMFCDQDDYWQPDKISSLLIVMREEELKFPGKAHIIFSDLKIADNELNETNPSFLEMMVPSKKNILKKGQQVSFLKNYVPGCNMLFNRALVKSALTTENSINLHDHWLLMVCSSIGKITFVDKALMKYRMHDRNAIGFNNSNNNKRNNFLLFLKDCFKFGFNNKGYRNKLYSKNILQLQNICKSLPSLVSKEATYFSTINSSNYFTRKIRNIFRPFILEKSVLKQLTYLFCF